MKQFIVLLASLPLLLLFLLQFSLDQLNYSRLGLAADCVYVAKEEARLEGCFTQEISDQLRQDLATILAIDPALVVIESSKEPVFRVFEGDEQEEQGGEGAASRGLIHYRVKAPVGPALAGLGFLGLGKEENQLVFQLESSTASERLP